ncbi:MAG: histidine triad nucleotide-binding protein [Clostridia bacterium]|nr:histidine triad nucleotide-binding protein [Clostridia bacterium]
MNDCIFCKIINKEIPSNIVFENEKVIVFEDLAPVAPVHILIVPKKHMASAIDLESEEDFDYIKEVYKVAKIIAQEKEISGSGFRIVNNCGEDGGQTVKHIHFHLIGGRKLEGMA